jgi:cold shock CspA family protein
MVDTERQIGQVKWFNRQTGWGFITILDNKTENDDIFVHWRSLRIDNEQFKYLVAGEYVELNVKLDESNKKHPRTADDVTGVRCGKLMCEFRQDNKTSAYDEDVREKRTIGDIILGGGQQ